MIEYLFPLATIITPNSIEARQLAPAATSLEECAETLLSYGCEYVLLKGSHEATPDVRNVLYNKAGLVKEYRWPRLPHEYHGSGCTLAASIAALLAEQHSVENAVQQAQAYTWECLNHAYKPGKGQYVPDRTPNKNN
jgi:hydroxymethylpyrimidine/phosphomethylpyrimidine kinase